MCLFVNALFTGYGAITGDVFCSCPTRNYWIGIAGTFLWVIESTADLVLALNRCVGVISPKSGDFLFEGNRTWLWLIPVSLYSLYFIVFTKPVIFTGIFVTWYFNPHAGYIVDVGESEYRNELHSFHNILIFFGISGLYTAFTLAMLLKYIRLRGALKLSVAERMTFLQTFAISFFNGLAAGLALYVQLDFVKVAQVLMDIGAYAWTTAHGIAL
ncbi:serpentine type 7TM GPCR chemoreceptor srt domain-containing protein [Ditylenchus destructor]|nr:serpentine type 7TM GPCR chemoreceptor srt domain-containing protein [Ditylenchus destructor]